MKVKVKLYAMLSRFGGGERAGTPLSIDLPEEATLLDLIKLLNIPPEEARITFVNGITQELGWRLKEGDEVGMFPPIAGG